MKDEKDSGTMDFLSSKETPANCFNCCQLSATCGGWYCDTHNIFLHEQIHPEDIGHGGNGCKEHRYKNEPIFIGIDLSEGKSSTHYSAVKNNKD